MASFLNQATGARCLVVESLGKVPKRDDIDTRNKNLVLWDCFGKDVESCLLEYDIEVDRISYHNLLALFNVSHGLGIEEKVVVHGAEGLFYEQDSAENLAKGVHAIFGGELWIPRQILADYMRKNSRKNQIRKKKKGTQILHLEK